jgi:hypothetical protein
MLARSLWIVALTLAMLMLAATANAVTTMLITITPVGLNWNYDFLVNYGGEALGSQGFASLEVEIPDYKVVPPVNPPNDISQPGGTATYVFTQARPYTGTNQNFTIIGSILDPDEHGNANWGPHANDVREIETPDQEGFDPSDASEVSWEMGGHTQVPGLYEFSFVADTNLSQSLLHWELHGDNENDQRTIEGTGSTDVPEPATLGLFGLGLLGLGIVRRRRTAR